jgi:hypothetical protein
MRCEHGDFRIGIIELRDVADYELRPDSMISVKRAVAGSKQGASIFDAGLRKNFSGETLLTFWFPTAEPTPCDARELVYRLEALMAG